MNAFTNLVYIIASILFIYGLKMLGRAQTARRGNLISAIGMLLAVITVLLTSGLHYVWVFVGILIGGAIGAVAARQVHMTQMPEMVALFNGSGGIASLLVGWSQFHAVGKADNFTGLVIALAILIGGVTFTGSLVAFGKLAGHISGKPILFEKQRFYNTVILGGLFVLVLMVALLPRIGGYIFLIPLIVAAFIFGVLAVIPIGGADMPIVISLLNSYSGLAASAAGFAIGNSVLIVAGSLVGASGLILTRIMCKAMNRSLFNVLLGGFGAQPETSGISQAQGEIKDISVEDAFVMLEAADRVVIVPGYGMAVAQAQHVVRELGELLEENDTEVEYVIHPVAGRMPGHMNVLLAEANVPYDKLVEPEDVNPIIDSVDIAIVIGANDVVNTAAREQKDSPIYGMPIIDVDKAKNVFVLKRSTSAGFSGVSNPLFYKSNTRMLFGDAKDTISRLIAEFKDI